MDRTDGKLAAPVEFQCSAPLIDSPASARGLVAVITGQLDVDKYDGNTFGEHVGNRDVTRHGVRRTVKKIVQLLLRLAAAIQLFVPVGTIPVV
jgi:hypothetical protein